MFEVLVIISAIFVWIVYHKVFSVVYFDLSKGCLTEIFTSILGGIVLAYLIMNYWFIAIPVIVFIVYKMLR